MKGSSHNLDRLRKSHKNLSQGTTPWAEIWTQDIPNTKQVANYLATKFYKKMWIFNIFLLEVLLYNLKYTNVPR